MNNDKSAFDLLTDTGNKPEPQRKATANTPSPGAFSFSGRARRSTYWGMVVITILVSCVLSVLVMAAIGENVLRAFEYGFEDGMETLGGGDRTVASPATPAHRMGLGGVGPALP